MSIAYIYRLLYDCCMCFGLEKAHNFPLLNVLWSLLYVSILSAIVYLLYFIGSEKSSSFYYTLIVLYLLYCINCMVSISLYCIVFLLYLLYRIDYIVLTVLYLFNCIVLYFCCIYFIVFIVFYRI